MEVINLAEITVNQFIAAQWQGQRNRYTNWQDLFMQYLDISGIGQTRQKDLMVVVHSLQNRLLFIFGVPDAEPAIPGYLEFQRMFYMAMDEPCTGVFVDIKKYGHNLTWNASDPGNFLYQLKKIDAKERRNKAELDLRMKELKEVEAGIKVVVKSKSEERLDFIRHLNSLNLHGYTIDREKTDMETVSLMIKEFSDNREMLNKSK